MPRKNKIVFVYYIFSIFSHISEVWGLFLNVSYAHQGGIYLIKNNVKQ